MSDAQKLIADVLGLHFLEKCMRVSTSERTEWWQCLGCGWESEEFDLDDTEVRREIERVKRAHLAAEIDKALGGLRVESALRVTVNQTDRRIVLTDPTDISAARRFATEENNTLADVSRWVSGWSEVQS